MPTQKKVETVKELENLISKSTIVITADYRGLSAMDMLGLRRRLREIGVEVRVVKNTLARLAAEQVGRPNLVEIVEGPTAIAFGYGDVREPTRVLTEYIRASRLPMTIRGALLDSRVLGPEDVSVLSTLPSRDVLVAQVIGGIQAPIASFIYVLNGTLAGLLTVLQGRVEQLKGEAP